MKNIEAVIFDMDGLLVDSEPLWQQACIEVFDTLGINISNQDLIETIGIPTRQVFEIWYKRKPWQNKTIDELEIELIDKMATILNAKAKPMLGAIECVDYFKSKNLKIGVASASPLQIIEICLSRIGIRKDVDFFHSGTLEKHNKPDPAIYLSVADKLSANINNCLIFEDSINGVKGALASGAKVVAVPDVHFYDNQYFEKAHLKVSSLLHFLNHIETNFEIHI